MDDDLFSFECLSNRVTIYVWWIRDIIDGNDKKSLRKSLLQFTLYCKPAGVFIERD